MTAYHEVSTDRDVAAFIAMHPLGPALVQLGILKAWAARQNGKVVAVLALRKYPFLALNYLPADMQGRTFMRLYKLWQMAECWLVANGIPAVAVDVHDSILHMQFILRKLGFEAIGESEAVGSTVYAKRFEKEAPDAHSKDGIEGRRGGAEVGDAILEGDGGSGRRVSSNA